MGMFWALMKPKGLLGEKGLSCDPAAEVCLEKVEGENGGRDMERHGEAWSPILLMKERWEMRYLLVDEAGR